MKNTKTLRPIEIGLKILLWITAKTGMHMVKRKRQDYKKKIPAFFGRDFLIHDMHAAVVHDLHRLVAH